MTPQQLVAATRRLRRQTVLEAIEQSPRRALVSDPRRERRINQNGKPEDYVMRFYVDFERPIPDDLFRVE